ncbi:hypothetical protein V5O48_019332, partial [Marasmius crinis-equi]
MSHPPYPPPYAHEPYYHYPPPPGSPPGAPPPDFLQQRYPFSPYTPYHFPMHPVSASTIDPSMISSNVPIAENSSEPLHDEAPSKSYKYKACCLAVTGLDLLGLEREVGGLK